MTIVRYQRRQAGRDGDFMVPAGATIDHGKIEQRAKALLEGYDLLRVPIDPVLLANRMGVRVLEAAFHERDISGVVVKRGRECLILVNQADPPTRKRFTIAHELGHCVLHLNEDGNKVDRDIDLYRSPEASLGEYAEEIEANRFAAALLMPAELVRNLYQSYLTVADLAQVFQVSEESMGYRLSSLGLSSHGRRSN